MRRRRNLVAALAGVLIAAVWIRAGFAAAVPSYSITADIDPVRRHVEAVETVHFINTSDHPVEEAYFYIYANRRYTKAEKEFMMLYAGYFKVNPFPEGFDSGRFEICSVKDGTESVSFSIEGEDSTWLKVLLNHPLAPGASVALRLQFTMDLPHAYGRLGWHENIIKLSRWYPMLAVLNADGWQLNPFYPFHRPFFSDAAAYDVELTVPQDQVVIHPGVLVSETATPTGRKTLKVVSGEPLRDFSLAMSRDYQVTRKDLNGMTISSFYLPGDEAHGRMAAQIATDLMAFYTKKFGPVPYKTFSIAPVHLGYGGEQMSNVIFIDTRVYRLPGILDRYFDFLIAHETGHQWFYNLVGFNNYEEMWMEEGIHSCFVLDYLEDKYGKDAAVVQFPEWFKGFEWLVPNLTFRRTREVRYKMITRIGLDHPVVGTLSSFKEPSSIFSLTYGKGSRIVGMLRHVIGDAAFDRVFERIFREYRFKNLSVEEFIALCEEESGRDLHWFFNPWLYSEDYLDVAVRGLRGNRILLQNRGDVVMPTDIRITFRDGKQQTLRWEPERDGNELTVDDVRSVARVEADPDAHWVDIDRTNNAWPRHLRLIPVPVYIGLYDIPVFMPEDGYNFVFGPEVANGGLGLKASLQKPYDQNLYGGVDYEFGEQITHSRVGYRLKNVLRSNAALGFEIRNQTDHDGGEEDLVSGKAYFRKELKPVQYGLFDNNDHVTFYVIRNQSLNGPEDTRNISYLKYDEAIAGVALHIERAGPYPDPHQGFKVDMLMENSGHFLGATQYFQRAAMDGAVYQPVTLNSVLAFRLKYGWGAPGDKNLYQLGGVHGLRGYDRKEIRGSNALLGSVEYRFPVIEHINKGFLDNLIGLESVGGVAFFDGGKAWYADAGGVDTKKDAGIGLRFTVNFGSFLEKAVIRFDAAKAINDSGRDPRFWFGINHAF